MTSSTPEPTPPLTDDRLRAFRECLSDAMHRSGELYLTTEAPKDMLLLLDEVDRLRAENTALRRNASFAAAVVSGDAAEMLTESLAKARAERDALAARLEAARGLRRSWLADADDARFKADNLDGLTEVERAETRVNATQLEFCARQLGRALGPDEHEDHRESATTPSEGGTDA